MIVNVRGFFKLEDLWVVYGWKGIRKILIQCDLVMFTYGEDFYIVYSNMQTIMKNDVKIRI